MIKSLESFWRTKESHEPWPVPEFSAVPQPGCADAVCHPPQEGETAWYPLPLIGASTLADAVLDPQTLRQTVELMKSLTPDDYISYLIRFFEDGLQRFGDGWRYADITTTLLGIARVLKPKSYLEIGVRRGRSVCAVASQSPHCELAMFDKWVTNYAGMENPGPEFVQSELKRIGHDGPVEFINGNSHQTLPEYFKRHPQKTFDLITVDGDHSDWGAAQDLCDVLPHLSIGGVVVFDDVCHPKHLSLRSVWNEVVASDRRMSSWMFDDVGYGVAFALRKW